MPRLIVAFLICLILVNVFKRSESKDSTGKGKGKDASWRNCDTHTDCPDGSACMLPGYGKANEVASKKCYPCSCSVPTQCFFEGKTLSCNCSGSGFTGSNCSINIDDCVDVQCPNNSFCVDGINDYTCECDPGFTGEFCETNIDECQFSPCQNDGTCIDGVNEVTCICNCQFTGDFCEIENPICENQDHLTNIALGKPSSQISIWNNRYDWDADKGNDGDSNDNIYQNHCFHTDFAVSPWWEVDLLECRCVSRVEIVNRRDCCVDRAQNVEISVAKEYGNWSVVAYQDGQMGLSLSLTFDPVVARYVRTTLRDASTWLHFCEVEVY